MEPALSYFDLLFLTSIAGSLVTLIVAAIAAVRGRRTRALGILRVWGIYAVVYIAAALAVDFFKPQRIMKMGDPWCFDHWCLTVEKVDRVAAPTGVSYDVKLRLFNSSHRVAQRANGAWIYLIDERGRRYSPNPDPAAVPLDVQLQPQESIATSRVFQVPADVQDLGLVTGHGGPYCGGIDLFIIGAAGCLFNKPAMIRIH